MRRIAVFIAIAGAWLMGGGVGTASAGTLIEERTEDQQLGGELNHLVLSEFFGVSMDLTGDEALIGALTWNGPPYALRGAVYDYRRDPSSGEWSLNELLVNPNATQNQNFGSAVSRSGDFAIVGATGGGSWRYGLAFAYSYDAGTESWSLDQEIVLPSTLDNTTTDACPPPSELARISEFGSAVAVSGDAALIISPYEDLCFLRSDYDPTGNPLNCAEQFQGDDDCRLVDRRTKDWIGTDAGAAYFYRRNATSGVWELEQRVEPNGLPLELFPNPTENTNVRVDDYSDNPWGRRDGMVDMDGDYAAIGNDRRGLVWLYRYNQTSQQWVELNQSPISHPLGSNGAQVQFGAAVSISGEWMAVGADLEDIGSQGTRVVDAGAVFIYRRNFLDFWVHQTPPVSPLLLANQERSDQFGRDVELTADTLVVGAMSHLTIPTELPNGNIRWDAGAGAAYVFDFDPGVPSFTERYKLVASNGEELDGLGGSIAYSDGTALIAAPRRNVSTGSVYSYDLTVPASGVSPIPEPARALLALSALAALALLRSLRLRALPPRSAGPLRTR